MDASALIAMLRDEPGGAKVASVIGSAMMSVVNHAEVVAHYVRHDIELPDIHGMLQSLPVTLIDADQPLAADAGHLIAKTKRHGLSLGDRFCLALARREGLPVWTADRSWLKIAAPVGLEVVAIR